MSPSDAALLEICEADVADQPQGDPLHLTLYDHEELMRVRAHVHTHSNILMDQGSRLARVETQVTALLQGIPQLATREQVASTQRFLEERIQNIHDDISPLKRGIYWIVTLVLGAVILGILALLFRTPGS